MVAMGIIIGTCVPDAEQDSAYGAQIRRPPRRILYGMHSMVLFNSVLLYILIKQVINQDKISNFKLQWLVIFRCTMKIEENSCNKNKILSIIIVN